MPANIRFTSGEDSPWLDRGHGTEALGPSDSSDSGSDMQGMESSGDAAELGLDPGLVDTAVATAGAARLRYAHEPDPDDTVINYPKK